MKHYTYHLDPQRMIGRLKTAVSALNQIKVEHTGKEHDKRYYKALFAVEGFNRQSRELNYRERRASRETAVKYEAFLKKTRYGYYVVLTAYDPKAAKPETLAVLFGERKDGRDFTAYDIGYMQHKREEAAAAAETRRRIARNAGRYR